MHKHKYIMYVSDSDSIVYIGDFWVFLLAEIKTIEVENDS
jgi:hypothetical protein